MSISTSTERFVLMKSHSTHHPLEAVSVVSYFSKELFSTCNNTIVCDGNAMLSATIFSQQKDT